MREKRRFPLHLVIFMFLFLPVLAVAIKVFTVGFLRDTSITGAFSTEARVNSIPEITAWGNLFINNQKFATIYYADGASEKYVVWDWRSTAPLKIVPGTYSPRAADGTSDGDTSCGGERSCGSAEPERSSPLIVDLDDDGLNLAARGDGVLFDIRANGEAVPIQWVHAMGDEAFLVRDLNGNNAIDDGSELFGEGTMMEIEGRRAVNGFQALAQYDAQVLGGNEDGLISSQDAIWTDIFLWIDWDADGESRTSEFLTLESQSISELSLSVRKSNRVDSAGNRIALWSWAIGVNPDGARDTKRLVDVFFREMSWTP